MKRILSSIVLLCFCLCVYAQNYDVNMDGKVDILDITTLVDGVVKDKEGKQYYSKEQVDSLFNIFNQRVKFLESFINLHDLYSPNSSFERKRLVLKEGDKSDNKCISLSNGEFEYMSNDPNVCSVEQNGEVIALSVGTATITCNTSKTSLYLPSSIQYGVRVIEAKYPYKNRNYRTPEPVDLGLPSGTLWADTNLGTSSVSNTGYTINNHDVNIESFSILDIYKIPTKKQWLELFACEHYEETINGLDVMVFVGNNGNKIKIPITDNGYWTSSVEDNDGSNVMCRVDLKELTLQEFFSWKDYWISSSGKEEFYYESNNVRLAIR